MSFLPWWTESFALAGWWKVRTVLAPCSLTKAIPKVFMAIEMPRPR
ncbi:hypothetical protein ACFPZI_32820 [Streptomyces chlorus]|uniref:Uncharacterized protein n=1 Tax=Streptomyces chlorus TaxID=887452 RepID=A0ABW1E792_9ACTN